MIKNLIIAGSSFLVSNHNSWLALKENYKVHFLNYSDFNGALSKKEHSNILALVLSLGDLVDENCNQITFKKIIGPLLFLLERRLQQCHSATILCLSEGEKINLIKKCKDRAQLSINFNWLIENCFKLSKKYKNFYLINLDDEFSEIGLNNVFDYRNWYFARCRYSSDGLKIISSSISKVLNRHFNPAKKVLVLDCDNTLWGGVVGEDGVGGLILGQDGLGQAYVDFQKEIKKLIDEGVIIVLASKNNEKDVWEVFKKHTSMILKKKDIVAWKINWDEKHQNIKQIASDLNLSLNSFVFWDDNPIERVKVKKTIPEVYTVDVPSEIIEWKKKIRSLDCFLKFTITKDDKRKKTLYQNRAKFIRDVSLTSNIDEYLKSIKLTPSAHKLNDANILRAEQLCLKTNQFNLRSIRYTSKELEGMSKKNANLCFLTSLKDIYGDHGIVGLCCIKILDKKTVFLDTMLMSCRVLGRHLESWMLKECLIRSKNCGYEYLIAEFIPSERNSVASSFLLDHNFKILKKFSNTLNKIYINKIEEKKNFYIISTNNKSLPNMKIYEKN